MSRILLLLCVVAIATAIVEFDRVKRVTKRQGTTPYLPSNEEQLLLEYVNRFRTNPKGELALLVNVNNILPNGTFLAPASNDPQISASITFFNINGTVLLQQFAALTPVAPIAWNNLLGRSAAYWNGVMMETGIQDHNVTGYPLLGARVTATGYQWGGLGENIYAYTTSDVLYTHAAWVIDWGFGGIQNPPGHRNNLLGPYREIGGALTTNTNKTNNGLGDVIATQDFGTQQTDDPILLGTVYRDANGNSFYDVGEAVGNAAVKAVSGNTTLTTNTNSAGGYSLPLPAGTYTVTITTPTGTKTATVTMASTNVKTDYLVPAALATSTSTSTSTSSSTSSSTSTSTSSSEMTSAVNPDLVQSSGAAFDIAKPMWIGIIAGGGAFIIIVIVVIIVVVVVVKKRSGGGAPSYERQFSTQSNLGQEQPTAIPIMSMTAIHGKMNVLHGSVDAY